MYDDALIKRLEAIAYECRRINLASEFGHGGGCTSLQDVAVALYFYKLKHDPQNPNWAERDRVVLGKSHAAGALYAPLALAGYFPKEQWIPLYGGNKFYPDTWRTPFQMHAEAWSLPGIDFTGGSLGQGLGFACGLAWAARLRAPRDRFGDPQPRYTIYCISGDGEANEGLFWESAMFAGRHRLTNLVNIVDYNQYNMSETMGSFLEPVTEKFASFGWWVDTVNGHDMRDICRVLDLVENIPDKPKCIIAHTIKGKGVPPWEFDHIHGSTLTPQQREEALTTYLKPLPEGIDAYLEE